jgi:hypothetical protein
VYLPGPWVTTKSQAQFPPNSANFRASKPGTHFILFFCLFILNSFFNSLNFPKLHAAQAIIAYYIHVCQMFILQENVKQSDIGSHPNGNVATDLLGLVRSFSTFLNLLLFFFIFLQLFICFFFLITQCVYDRILLNQ